MCLHVWAHWDTCGGDWLAFKCHSLCKCSVSHFTGQILYQQKCTSLPPPGDQGDRLWARENHQLLCFEAENPSTSHYPEQHPQIGCRRLRKQEWRKAAGDRGTEWMRQTGSGLSCPTLLPWSIPGTPHHPRGCQRKQSHGLFTQQLPSTGWQSGRRHSRKWLWIQKAPETTSEGPPLCPSHTCFQAFRRFPWFLPLLFFFFFFKTKEKKS